MPSVRPLKVRGAAHGDAAADLCIAGIPFIRHRAVVFPDLHPAGRDIGRHAGAAEGDGQPGKCVGAAAGGERKGIDRAIGGAAADIAAGRGGAVAEGGVGQAPAHRPTSQVAFCGRAVPRWVGGDRSPAAIGAVGILSMADCREQAWVCVGPPLLARAPMLRLRR